MSLRCAILISGGGSNMEALVRDMAAPVHPATPCLVLSNVAEAGGLAKAAAHGIPTAVVPHTEHKGDREGFEARIAEALAVHGAELVCLAGFMRVLTPGFCADWDGRMLNIHPSLLPKYRGLDTHARAIAAGDAEAGCTVHEVTAELDGGPILGQARVPILPGDTPQTLAARILPLEHRLYPAVLRRFAKGDRSPLQIG